MKLFKAIKKFLKLDFKTKIMFIEALFLTGFYRYIILTVEFKNISKDLGKKGEELSRYGAKDGYIMADKVSVIVNKVSDITLWQSKCLVRAMTAQKMMSKRGYGTTLYLGVKKDLEGMTAHAWLRYGQFYLTGGNGSQFALVSKFAKNII